MDSLIIQHLTFNFLGLQLVILALVLIMGNYTGFRLSELKRFKPLVEQINAHRNGDETEPEYVRLKRELNTLKSNPRAFDTITQGQKAADQKAEAQKPEDQKLDTPAPKGKE